MQIYYHIQKGEYHENYCEDYLYFGKIGTDKILCAVMDGCSTAMDSYFMSTLVGKILRKIVKERGYREWHEGGNFTADLEAQLKSILKDLMQELKFLKNQLMLEDKEMLTTLILLLVDKKKDEGIILVIGDGWISVNGKNREFDQDNKPDYIGFHLFEDFDVWYSKQHQKAIFNTIQNISIATDGISTFTQISKKEHQEVMDPINYLMIDREKEERENMLELKMKILEHQFGLKPTDDLALIRIIS